MWRASWTVVRNGRPRSLRVWPLRPPMFPLRKGRRGPTASGRQAREGRNRGLELPPCAVFYAAGLLCAPHPDAPVLLAPWVHPTHHWVRPATGQTGKRGRRGARSSHSSKAPPEAGSVDAVPRASGGQTGRSAPDRRGGAGSRSRSSLRRLPGLGAHRQGPPWDGLRDADAAAGRTFGRTAGRTSFRSPCVAGASPCGSERGRGRRKGRHSSAVVKQILAEGGATAGPPERRGCAVVRLDLE